MSDTMSMTAARSAAKKDCGCGCGGSGTDCCEIECLVHPRFFCGQLLADQDLTALVDWVKAKGTLARYRHGWGVVCGLEVHCGKDGSVTVSPGYAMDCCGRDIVVCEETPFPLAPCWKRPNDPCGVGAAQSAGTTTPGTTAAFQFGQPATTNNDPLSFIPPEELQAVDILIRYAESQSDSRTALARGGCGGAPGCEYTRVHESFEIYCRPAVGCEVTPDPSSEWEKGYQEALAMLVRDLDRILSPQVEAPIDRLIEYVTRHSPHTFCFIREWLCYLQGTQKTSDPKTDAEKAAAQKAAAELRATLSQVAFWIVQDWRNEYLLKPCRGCGPDTGIPLARVWMWMRRDSRGKEKLTTVYVNAYPPFRRALSNDEWQLPADKVNLAPYVWQPVDTVRQSLQRAGLTPKLAPIDANIALVTGDEILLANATTDTTETLTMYHTTDPHCPDHIRVVAFARLAPKKTEAEPAPLPTQAKTGTPTLETPPPANPATPVESVPATQPQPSVVDLTQLGGIGPARAERLRNAGINTIADLAAARPTAVREALGTPAVADSLVEQMIAQAQAQM